MQANKKQPHNKKDEDGYVPTNDSHAIWEEEWT
jgi:hypothetical protein